jgi:hypothetical protein
MHSCPSSEAPNPTVDVLWLSTAKDPNQRLLESVRPSPLAARAQRRESLGVGAALGLATVAEWSGGAGQWLTRLGYEVVRRVRAEWNATVRRGRLSPAQRWVGIGLGAMLAGVLLLRGSPKPERVGVTAIAVPVVAEPAAAPVLEAPAPAEPAAAEPTRAYLTAGIPLAGNSENAPSPSAGEPGAPRENVSAATPRSTERVRASRRTLAEPRATARSSRRKLPAFLRMSSGRSTAKRARHSSTSR